MSICCCEPPGQEIEFWMPSRLMGPQYEVSDKGRVRSLSYRGITGVTGVIYQQIRGRYWSVKNNNQMCFFVHELVADAFIGPRPSGMQINHINGNKDNNRKENLEYCTASENTKHAYRIGLSPSQKGENNPSSVLTEDKVREIRGMVKGGLSHAETAARFGVSRSTVGFVVSGKRWGHVL